MNETKPNITHIFCDVDYTVFVTNKDEYVLSTIEALELAHKNGKKIIIVSSKSIPTLEEIRLFKTLPYIDGYLCSCMGYGVVGDKVYDYPLPKDTLLECSEMIDQECEKEEKLCFQFICKKYNEINGKVEFSKKIYTYSIDIVADLATKYADEWKDRLGSPIDKLTKDGLDDLFEKEQIYAIMVFSDSSKTRKRINDFFNQKFDNGKLYVSEFDNVINVTYYPVDKGQWLNRLYDDFKISPKNCLAIGDSENDLVNVDNCIAVKNDYRESSALKRIDDNSNLNYKLVANLESDDIYNALHDLDLFASLSKDESINGLLAHDVLNGTLKEIGFVSCSKTSDKNIDSWLGDKDVYFLGVNGISKVSGKEEDANSNYSKLKGHLLEISTSENNTQKYKVLLMNPDSKKFDNLLDHINDYEILETYRETYKKWLKLADIGGGHLDLRFYNTNLPFFMKAVKDDCVAISKFSSDSQYSDSLSKKEPSFVVDFKRIDETKENGKKVGNHFCNNIIRFFDSKFENSERYDNKNARKLTKLLDRKINNKEKALKPTLFCYSSSTSLKQADEYKEAIKQWGCSPIDWKEYYLEDNWLLKIQELMKKCSCVIFFIDEDTFDNDDNYVAKELVEFYKIQSKKLFRNKAKYLFISLLSDDDLKDRFANEIKRLETTNDNKEKLLAFRFYNKAIVTDGKKYYQYGDFDELENFLNSRKIKRKRIDMPERKSGKTVANNSSQDGSVNLSNLIHSGLRRCFPEKIKINPSSILTEASDPSRDVKISSISEFALSENKVSFMNFLDKRIKNYESNVSEGKVKILLLDPESEYFDEMMDNIENLEVKIEHINSFKTWVSIAEKPRYKGIVDIRIYRETPQLFKIYSASDSFMSVQPYKNSIDGQIEPKIKYPTLLLERGNKIENPDSLFSIFDKIFDDMFDRSRPIKEVANYVKNDFGGKYDFGKRVDIKDYVKSKKDAKRICATKIRNIKVSEFDDESFATYSSNVEESFYLNKKDHSPLFVATKLDENNKEARDDKGNLNQWLISKSRLEEKYVLSNEEERIYSPKNLKEEFIKVDEDIYFKIKDDILTILFSGGYINVTNPDNYYGINEKDFLDTYKVED